MHFLLVEDTDLVAVVCRRTLAPYGAVSVVETAVAARRLLPGSRYTGLVADITLPDGSGLDIAREAREIAKTIPILIISGGVDQVRLDVADQLEASFLLKPIERSQLTRFAERAIARQQRVAALLRTWFERYGLSAAESVNLRLSVDGLKRREIAEARRVSPNTVKIQVGTMLSKIGSETVAEAVVAFYMELASSGPC